MQSVHKKIKGCLFKEVLFKGSKSEREYVVLRTDKNETLRLYIIGKNMLFYDIDVFENLLKKKLEITGLVDEIRGHLRIGINSLEDVKIIK